MPIMPQNLLNSDAKEGIIARISSLSPDAQAIWGIMDANQMLCHTADQLRVALGDIPAAVTGNIFMRTVAKWVVVAGFPIPKGTQTMAEVDPLRKGTQPTHPAQDSSTLIASIERFSSHPEGKEFSFHPIFGRMSRNQWGKLAWIHLDHHLRQFGG